MQVGRTAVLSFHLASFLFYFILFFPFLGVPCLSARWLLCYVECVFMGFETEMVKLSQIFTTSWTDSHDGTFSSTLQTGVFHEETLDLFNRTVLYKQLVKNRIEANQIQIQKLLR